MANYTSLETYEIHSLAKRYGVEVSELTISDNRPLEDVINMVRLLDFLAEYDFPASRVVPLLDGEKVTVYREKPVILKSYIPGETIRNIPEKGLYTLGLTLARLHQIPAPDFIPQTHSFGLDTFSEAMGLNFDVEV